MNRYSLQQAATLLGTGRTTLCAELREQGIFDANNLPLRHHVTAGRFHVQLKAFKHPGLGEEQPYGKTLVTDRGLLWLANVLKKEIVTHREAANDEVARHA
ncbi:Phage antirepressor protein KilAC domain-containing protein [Onishia taeanensis]|uniref:Phage antirepressor protein KilAC domain-containing protein n=1 Tax=Onishia taeanensis TaxID=284577 RepID=A0A1G7N4X9_9GAMM|nr:phage antirepressor KilAC domain-containing protein [Halomonas taeanensis]SDF69064.1 Phage antirepressor protein KilAC domain-containing protein [Halomonas taeanensis]